MLLYKFNIYMSSMFDLLMELPLFRGVSHDTMKNIVGMAKFHFLKYPEGAVVVKDRKSVV